MWYWFSRPDASAYIETAVQEAGNSLEQSFDLVASQQLDSENDESLMAFWNSFGDGGLTEFSDTSSSDDNDGEQGNTPPGSRGGSDDHDEDDELLSLGDAESLLASSHVLSRLQTESIRSELAADPRVRQLLETARRIVKRRGVRIDSGSPTNAVFSELSEAEKLSIARAAESQIAAHAFRFEQAALDQSIESIWRTESHFRVLHRDLRELLPSSSSLPDDPLSIAPTEILQKAVRVMQTHRQQLQRQIAILGIGPDSEAFQVGRVYALVDKTINRIQDILESEEHAKFQAQKGAEYEKITKKKWTEVSESHAQRFSTEASSRLNVLHAELGWPELREGAADIRGPPLDAIVWSSIRDFDTNVRRWLQAESCVRALSDEIADLPEVRNVVSSETKSPLERVSLFLNDSTLRRGLLLANSIVSKTYPVEDEVFPGRREHFEEIAAAFHKEISRRDNGGLRLVTDTSSIEPLVNRYTDLNQPAVRAEARMLSLAAQRFPKLNLLPENIKSDIRSVQSRAIGRYAERIAQVISGYQEVANYLALATDPAPELLEKLKGARAELKAINSEFVEMVDVAKMYGTDVKSAKAILVQLECLFPRGPPEENPPPTESPRPVTPFDDGGGGELIVGTKDLERFRDTPKTLANPSLEKYIYLASARLDSAESIVESTLRDAELLNAQPVKFATALGRRIYDPLNIARKLSGEVDFLSIKSDMESTRLSKSLEDWEGRQKMIKDGRHIRKVTYDYQTEVKDPKSFEAIGGGIHFGEVATTNVDTSKHVFALRYDAGILFLLDGLNDKRYEIASSKEIDPTSLKSLFRFAKANRNAAISIGWVFGNTITDGEESASPILLDPYLVDTAVGQDLILADSIPWEFGEEKLPNGAPIPFHKEFEEKKDAYKVAELAEICDMLVGLKPYEKSQKAEWTKIPAEDFKLIEATRIQWVSDQVEQLRGSTGRELQNVRDALARSPDRVRQVLFKQFDSDILKLSNPDSSCDNTTISFLQSLIGILLRKGECPKSLVRFYASLVSSDILKKPVAIEELPSYVHAVLCEYTQSTTLSVLYDTSGSFELQEGNLVTIAEMEYLYAMPNFEFTNISIKIGSEGARDRKVKKIEELTKLANENLDTLSQSYSPLRRVIDRAALTAFLKWAISKQNEGVLLIDLSELAAVPANDPVKYPTPDWKKNKDRQ
jgi:hypothetical protein